MIVTWALTGSTLYTVIFGFTDGAADAYLILGTLSLYYRRTSLYVLATILAVLSRENLAIFPLALGASIGLGAAIGSVGRPIQERLTGIGRAIAPHLFILFAMVLWHLNVFYRIGTWPSSGVPPRQFGFPFYSALKYSAQSLGYQVSTVYADVTSWYPKYTQLVGINLFLLLIVVSVLVFSSALCEGWYKQKSGYLKSPACGYMIGSLILAVVYMSYGDIMMWVPVGYVKSAGVLSFFLLFAYAISQRPAYLVAVLVSALNTAFSVFLIAHRYV